MSTRQESMWEAAFAALDQDPRRALKLARKARDLSPDAEAWYNYGSVALEAGDSAEAREAVRRTLALDPEHPDAWALLARLHFDVGAWKEADEAVDNALSRDEEHPEARYLRGCLLERRGQFDAADTELQAAHEEAPDDFPEVRWLSDTAIEAAAEAVLSSLPERVGAALLDVHILIDEVPSDAVLSMVEPRPSPDGLLACFDGAPVGDRGGSDALALLPATILLFRRNLMRIPPDALEAELEITLLHEIGHFLGLDEDDLEERGLG